MSCQGLNSNFTLINKINHYIQHFNGNFDSSRKNIRNDIVDLFKLEPAGNGTGVYSTREIYCVEQINNEVIYLKRPATLNNGFDFEIHTRSQQFGGKIKSRPRHEDIILLLQQIKISNINIFNQIQILIDQIYMCNEQNINSINYQVNNIDVETILKLIKWLFIEQDVTYWSFSGRKMLYNGLKNV